MTTSGNPSRRASGVVLPLALLVVLVTFGVPTAYNKGTHIALAVGQLFVVCASAWALGASALASTDPGRRRLAFVGSAFVAPFALFSLTAGFGTPDAANPAQNELRYALLTIDAVVVGLGFIALSGWLAAKGASATSNAARLAMLMATPLYVIFTLSQWGEYAASDDPRLTWITAYDRVSLEFLFAGALLTYAATAFIASALGHARLLDRVPSLVLIVLSIVAIAFAGTRIAVALTQGPLWGFDAWFEIPGFALLIPAVPWMMPCIVGILLLRRAGVSSGAPQSRS